jgi:hypothetical protein
MKAQISFDSSDSIDAAKERITQCFENTGYTAVTEADKLVFRRGSRLGSWTSMSPKKWQVVVKVDLVSAVSGGSTVTLNYDINATGQTVTPGEIRFWNTEMASIQHAISNNEPVANVSSVAEKDAIRSNWKLAGKWLLYGMAGVVLLFLLIPPVECIATQVSRCLVNLLPLRKETEFRETEHTTPN